MKARPNRLPALVLLTVAVAMFVGTCSDGGGDGFSRSGKPVAPVDGVTTTAAAAETPINLSSPADASDASIASDAPGSSGDSAAEALDDPSASAPPATSGTLDIEVAFAEACIRPGLRQTITVRTAPKAGVVYHAVYADGKRGPDPGYYGGNAGGSADEGGVYSDTWVVGAAAPSGTVSVEVVAGLTIEQAGYVEAEFAVASVGGGCP